MSLPPWMLVVACNAWIAPHTWSTSELGSVAAGAGPGEFYVIATRRDYEQAQYSTPTGVVSLDPRVVAVESAVLRCHADASGASTRCVPVLDASEAARALGGAATFGTITLSPCAQARAKRAAAIAARVPEADLPTVPESCFTDK